MAPTDLQVLERVAVGFALAYVFGFERQLRGSQAGDRTFAMIGASAAAITAVASTSSPQAIAGVVTGVGFIGACVLKASDDDVEDRQHEPCRASDGGRPSGFAVQAEIPNCRSVMSVKSRGGKRLRKRLAISGSGVQREDEHV